MKPILIARIARLLSVFMTSTMAMVFPTSITVPTATAQEEASCFVGVDYLQLSYADLAALIAQAVSQLPPGLSDAEIVAVIGQQIGAAENGCTPAQITALANNVTLILQDLGVASPGMNSLLVASIQGSTQTASVTGPVVPLSLEQVY